MTSPRGTLKSIWKAPPAFVVVLRDPPAPLAGSLGTTVTVAPGIGAPEASLTTPRIPESPEAGGAPSLACVGSLPFTRGSAGLAGFAWERIDPARTRTKTLHPALIPHLATDLPRSLLERRFPRKG